LSVACVICKTRSSAVLAGHFNALYQAGIIGSKGTTPPNHQANFISHKVGSLLSAIQEYIICSHILHKAQSHTFHKVTFLYICHTLATLFITCIAFVHFSNHHIQAQTAALCHISHATFHHLYHKDSLFCHMSQKSSICCCVFVCASLNLCAISSLPNQLAISSDKLDTPESQSCCIELGIDSILSFTPINRFLYRGAFNIFCSFSCSKSFLALVFTA